MLSYRHAFHAGNHADVLKHLVLVQLTRYLAQKDKPFWYIDTHSGAGLYALDAGYAQKLAEYKDVAAVMAAAALAPVENPFRSGWRRGADMDGGRLFGMRKT